MDPFGMGPQYRLELAADPSLDVIVLQCAGETFHC